MTSKVKETIVDDAEMEGEAEGVVEVKTGTEGGAKTETEGEGRTEGEAETEAEGKREVGETVGHPGPSVKAL